MMFAIESVDGCPCCARIIVSDRSSSTYHLEHIGRVDCFEKAGIGADANFDFKRSNGRS